MKAIAFRPLDVAGGFLPELSRGAVVHRLNMPKVPSLLFDIELEEEHRECNEELELECSIQELLALYTRCTSAEVDLTAQVRAAQQQAMWQGRPIDLDELAARLRTSGYTVKLRTALGGGCSSECLQNLRHQFLTCVLPGKGGVGDEVIVDPHFKAQFQVAHPSERYARLLEALPPEFVGTQRRIVPLLERLCSEMADSFAELGATLPPWRGAAGMLSKWRPRRSVDAECAVAAHAISQAVQDENPCNTSPRRVS